VFTPYAHFVDFRHLEGRYNWHDRNLLVLCGGYTAFKSSNREGSSVAGSLPTTIRI
jgi:hypothetical protein